jgi:CRISPR/Cas system-associated exonuclease Cas4 (RecB family)
MDTLQFIVILVLAIVLLRVPQRWAKWRSLAQEWSWLPAELISAEIAFSEREFRSSAGIAAVVDRAYRKPDGSVVLVEFKRRGSRVSHFSDIVELSAQRYAIEHCGAGTVENHAYVVTVDPLTLAKTPIPVELLGPADIERIADWHRQILDGSVLPEKANHAPLCRQCAYRVSCKPEALDEDDG